MLKFAVPSLVGLALAGAAFAVSSQPPEMPPMPKPSKEHEFLKQFVGEWEIDRRMHHVARPDRAGRKAGTRCGCWAASGWSSRRNMAK